MSAVMVEKWSESEIEALRYLYATHTQAEIAAILGRSKKAIVKPGHTPPKSLRHVPQQVLRLLAKVADGVRVASAARLCEVEERSAYHIVHGRSWGHLWQRS